MIELNGFFQVEVYKMIVKIYKIGEPNREPLFEYFSRVTQMIEIFNFISGKFWIPIHKMKIHIPSKRSNGYRELTHSTLLSNDHLYLYSGTSNLSIWVESERYDGSFKGPPKRKQIISPRVNLQNLRDFNSSTYLGRAAVIDSTDKAISPGVVGLMNMGNTCFLNSVIQSLINIPIFYQYFIKDDSLSLNNVHNHQDSNQQLVYQFGILFKKIWDGKTAITAPCSIHRLIIEQAPQFTGFRQHDAHEFLLYLLNGIHSNIENPKKFDDDLSLLDKYPDKYYWNRHLSEHYSIITESFHGLTKSNLTCPTCQKNSIVYEPFNSLNLPISQSTTEIISVTVFPASSGPKIYNISIEPFYTTVGMVKDKLVELTGINIDDMLLTQMKGGLICKGYAKDINPIPTLASSLHHFFLYELPLCISDWEKDNEIEYNNHSSNSMKPFTVPVLHETNHSNQKKKINTDNVKSLKELNPSFCSSIEVQQTSLRKRKNYLDTFIPLNEVVCQFICRQFVSRSTSSKIGVSLFGVPFLVRFSRYSSYSQVVKIVEEKLKLLTNYEIKKSEMKVRKSISLEEKISPRSSEEVNLNVFYSLRLVTQSGTYCGVCDASKNCRGCPLEDIGIRHLDNGKSIAVDIYCNIEFNNFESFKTKYSKEEKSSKVNLDDCIKQYLSREILSAKDSWYCNNCDDKKQAIKKLDFSLLPDILVIQLKRFSSFESSGKKICSFIDFPLYNFNLGQYIENSNEKNSNDYNLFAVIVSII